jgi:membrane-bound metal-dependent hydrolase YbcI (DUF457 family)
MDILTHAISGLAVGTAVVGISQKSKIGSLKIIGISVLGALLPDIDTVTMWSKFDGTFGKLFHLSYQGCDIYSMKLWYSHHGFFHSIIAALLFTFILGLVIYLFNKKQINNFSFAVKNNLPVLIGFFAGFFIHLLEDMPTPSSSWGGVRLFFPLKAYIGGSGDIWWWNNYDVFLIVLVVLLINCLILAIQYMFKLKIGKMTVLFFFVGVISCFIQIKSRKFDFNNYTYQKCEQKSKEIQQHILGTKLYKLMIDFDNRIKLNF